jgi:two-component system nitrogen regulation sensor histidine kinase NtrY
MLVVVTLQCIGLWRAWRNQVAGARLHIRIVALFSVIAAVPAILLAFAATTTFSRSLDGWFSVKTRAIIDNSLDVAKAYLDEHGQVIRSDIVNMVHDLDSAPEDVRNDPRQLQQLVMIQAGLRDLPVAYMIDATGTPLLTAIEDARLPYVKPPESIIRQAEDGQVPIITPANSNRVAAIAKLENFPGRYLYVTRGVSAKVMRYLHRTEQDVDEYNQLRKARGGLKLAHGLMYFMISMTALLAAIWVGLWFAGRFVAPIRRLIAAAQSISRGNLHVELPEKRGEGDLRRLSQTFNNMTRELRHQRDALVTANAQLLERRHFMEAVLSGVSAGVIGIDSHDRITLVSRSAETLLGIVERDLVGSKLEDHIPAFAEILSHFDEQSLKHHHRAPDQITIPVGAEERTFAVQVTRERASDGDVGSVVTFDDITDLVAAQRTAAWADVARRIAHEIKNPLTPIQLSAERIRKKYGKVITEDRETFDKLTDTIQRQVGDIKSMVDEFASFARMPKPQMEHNDLRHAVQESVVLFRESHPQIEFDLKMPSEPIHMSIDRRLITQAVTNLVKNASEAIQAAGDSPDNPEGWRGRIETIVTLRDDRVIVEVIDNGVGLPKQNRTRLLEPYVTTRAKGTGLGLAIVQKITEQHGGTLSLEDAPPAPDRPRGALVRMTLPYREADAAEADARPTNANTPEPLHGRA